MHVIFIISLNLKKVGRSGPRNITSNRYGLTNPMLLTPIQPKILTLKILHFAPYCANEYAKEKEEKEKNMTIFTK